MVEKIYIESQCSDDKLRNLSVELEGMTLSFYGEYWNDDDVDEMYVLIPPQIEKVKNLMHLEADSGSPDEVLRMLYKIVD